MKQGISSLGNETHYPNVDYYWTSLIRIEWLGYFQNSDVSIENINIKSLKKYSKEQGRGIDTLGQSVEPKWALSWNPEKLLFVLQSSSFSRSLACSFLPNPLLSSTYFIGWQSQLLTKCRAFVKIKFERILNGLLTLSLLSHLAAWASQFSSF